MSSTLRIDDVPRDSRERLAAILDQSFTGIYRWHARKILRSVHRVRAAARGGAAVGVTMFTMLGPFSGYVYYVAVAPSHRAAGVGGLLLDDALGLLRTESAREVFACIRADNTASLRLFESRGFTEVSFRELARGRGFGSAARLWMRMVVAPGERVFRTSFRP